MSFIAVIAYLTDVTSTINLALLDRNAMNLDVSQAHRLLTPAKQARHLNNNFCMYCRDVNHYVDNCSKANRKTLLCKMIINNEKATTVKPVAFLKIISPANLENL